jgi:hypothetical protein
VGHHGESLSLSLSLSLSPSRSGGGEPRTEEMESESGVEQTFVWGTTVCQIFPLPI